MGASVQQCVGTLTAAAARFGEANQTLDDAARKLRLMFANELSVRDLEANAATLSDADKAELRRQLDKATLRPAPDASDVLTRLRALLEGGAP